jgi:hypothetical protein
MQAGPDPSLLIAVGGHIQALPSIAYLLSRRSGRGRAFVALGGLLAVFGNVIAILVGR